MLGAVVFAFAAGALSTVNPCGFAVLPAFLAYYLQQETDADAIPLVVRLLRSVGAARRCPPGSLRCSPSPVCCSRPACEC